MDRLLIYLYGDAAEPVVQACLALLRSRELLVSEDLEGCDLAIAPLLTTKLGPFELERPRLGTLIFHPSLLPRHRGRDAIKWAFRCQEAYSGATWFWADDGLDTGDVCEQEVLAIVPGEAPRDFYRRAIIPSAVRLLGCALEDISRGVLRRRPQHHESATYEAPIRCKA